MQTRFFQGVMLGLVLVGAMATGCSDSNNNPPADTGAPDVSADTGNDVTNDVAPPEDVTRDAAPEDVARDAAQDTTPPADVPASDVPAVDVVTDTGPADVARDVASDTAPADVPASDGGLAERCTASGGTVGMSLCCASVSDFPNLCTTGACGCAPSSSRMVMVCNCPEGRCFNGTACVAR